MSGYNCTAQCFEAWYAAHLTTCISQSSRLCYNDIFKVLKFSCSDRDRFQRKNTLISRTVGSLKVCLKYAGFTFTHSLVVMEHSSWRESLRPLVDLSRYLKL